VRCNIFLKVLVSFEDNQGVLVIPVNGMQF
jgi:hypothetical protein